MFKALVPFLFCTAAYAQTCWLADVRGNYVFQMSGMQSPSGSSSLIPIRALGQARFNGFGQMAGSLMITTNGVTTKYDLFDATIQVNQDCTGVLQYTLKSEAGAVIGPDKHEINVLNEGARVWSQVTDSPGRTAFLTSEFQRAGRAPGGCTSSMVRGSYLMRYDGWINLQGVNPRAPAGFFPAIARGIINVDSDTGVGTGTGIQNWGGMVIHTTLKSAVFQVNTDCTGTFEYQFLVAETNGTMSGSNPMIVTNSGDLIIVLQTALPAFQIYERVALR